MKTLLDPHNPPGRGSITHKAPSSSPGPIPWSAQTIYTSVAHEVARILGHLGGDSPDEGVSKAKQSARDALQRLQGRLQEEMAALDTHAEWETFTIAFYGETNAGKSTLIEALRILLGEQTKEESRAQFRALQASEKLTSEHLQGTTEALTRAGEKIQNLKASQNEVERSRAELEEILREQLSQLQERVRQTKASATLWQRLLNLLWPLPQEREAARVSLGLINVANESAVARAQARHKQAEAQTQFESAQQERARLDAGLKSVAPYADGGIIGKGHSDFTRQTTFYRFRLGETEFALLDVPGIEGKEAEVMDAILAAVRMAHAVFYVTDKAAPPQKGHGNATGTLEKIIQHLGAHTEVWTIFNKRITSPSSLSDTLVTAGERDALEVLDDKMRQQLGEAYRGTIPVSARVGFLALADCLVPESADDRGRRKFLARHGAEELLRRSNLPNLQQMFEGDLVSGHESKIRRSNFNKARRAVAGTSDAISELHNATFRPLEPELRDRAERAGAQLRIALDTLCSRLDAELERGVRDFKSKTRNNIYEAIKSDISNDEFKRILDATIQQAQSQLGNALPKTMECELERFRSDIAEILNQFEGHARELARAYGSLSFDYGGDSFELKFNLDNGLKVGALLGALAGAAILFWNPAGWFLAAVGAVTVIAGLTKALWGAISSDYRKAQQCKSADENLEKIAGSMRSSLRSSLRLGFPALNESVETLETALASPAAEIRDINQLLSRSLVGLASLSHTIKAEGER